MKPILNKLISQALIPEEFNQQQTYVDLTIKQLTHQLLTKIRLDLDVEKDKQFTERTIQDADNKTLLELDGIVLGTLTKDYGSRWYDSPNYLYNIRFVPAAIFNLQLN